MEDTIPQVSCDSITFVVVLVVMIQMIGLEEAQIGTNWCAMMQKVVSEVIAHVTKYTTTQKSNNCINRQNNAEKTTDQRIENEGWNRGEDQSEFVHGEVVMDTVESEVENDGNFVIWKPIVQVEQESVQSVLDDCPHEHSKNKGHGSIC